MIMKNRFFWMTALLCGIAHGIWAEGTPVMRFVPVNGEKSEVALNSLRKVVFTPDSVVLIAAKDGEQTPLYKYDYQAIVFGESDPEGMVTVSGERLAVKGEKFIKDGCLYIRHNNIMYNLLGNKIK